MAKMGRTMVPMVKVAKSAMKLKVPGKKKPGKGVMPPAMLNGQAKRKMGAR